MKYLGWYHNDMLNGTGLREVIFFTGCPHHCPGCFNPETWNPDCPGSKLWGNDETEELVRRLSQSHIDGVTFSGGDPLSHWNRSEVLNLCKVIKSRVPGKTVWIYTGYTLEELGDLDLTPVDVLVEGRYIESLRSPDLPWVGSSNQRVIYLR